MPIAKKIKRSLISGPKRGAAFVVLSCLLVTGFTAPIIRADSFDNQINSLQVQNAQGQTAINGLEGQAASYQDAISQLQAQINAIQAQISDNEARQASLQAQIIQDQIQIAHEKVVLGEDLKTMYVDGQMTTIEELATSNNLSDYVDKQTYRQAVQSKLQETLKQIAILQEQLQSQKTQVEQLLTAEHTQNDQVSAAQAQQAQLLAYNQSQQDAYTAQLQANNSKISQLRAEQAAAYAAYSHQNGVISYGVGSDGNGGYPSVWAYAPQDSLVDSWGMYNRECVSYAAWKEASYGKYVPYGLGNAADWARNAASYGIPVSSTPAVGTIAQWDANAGLSPLGHVAYVEAVNSDGSIEVSQYNFVEGQFSRMHVPSYDVARLNFIYF